MPIFVIAGKVNCPHFVHAIQIAQYLHDNLPDIVINKREFDGVEWNEFLLETNSINSWYVTKSPVIWKEVGFAGSKPHLIGGLSEFWEYIDDYYGAKTFIDTDTVAEICSQNFKKYKEKKKDSAYTLKSLFLGIYGFNNDLAPMMLPELLNVADFSRRNIVTIKIYDKDSLNDPTIEDDVRDIIEDFEADIQAPVKFQIIFCTTISFFIEQTEIILITEDYRQKDGEDKESWFRRCSDDMQELSDEINDCGEDDLKIICCHLGPVCFTATTITKYIREKYLNNVVAVTAHEGLKALNSVSKMTDIPISHLGAPAVWGFVGLDQFIDVQGIIVLQDIIRPYKRALKDVRDSTLPQKKIRKELRMLSCRVNQKHYENSMIKHMMKYDELGRAPILPLLRATLHLLELWSSPEKGVNVVISLGVYSDGSSGIPQGIVFSQPVTLNKSNIWVAFDKIPVSKESQHEIEKCKEFTNELIELIMDYL